MPRTTQTKTTKTKNTVKSTTKTKSAKDYYNGFYDMTKTEIKDSLKQANYLEEKYKYVCEKLNIAFIKDLYDKYNSEFEDKSDKQVRNITEQGKIEKAWNNYYKQFSSLNFKGLEWKDSVFINLTNDDNLPKVDEIIEEAIKERENEIKEIREKEDMLVGEVVKKDDKKETKSVPISKNNKKNKEVVCENEEESKTNKKIYDKFWKGYYTQDEINDLNDYYNGLDKDFNLLTTSHKDYAKKIAQASLAMDIAFREMSEGVTGADKRYKDLKDTFDSLSKSAQFSESMRSGLNAGISGISQVVEKIENKQWIYKTEDFEKDAIDHLLEQFSNIKKSL